MTVRCQGCHGYGQSKHFIVFIQFANGRFGYACKRCYQNWVTDGFLWKTNVKM